MRIAIVDPYYTIFLSEHYRTRRHLARAPYEEQLAALMERFFGTADAYSSHLRELGHEASELVANCSELQRRWAAEHGRSPVLRRLASLPVAGTAARARLLPAIAKAQIDVLDPDVVYFQDLRFFSRSELEKLRREGRLTVGQIASPAPGVDLLRGYDLITTSFPHFVQRFRGAGLESEYLKLAFDSRVIDRLAAAGIDAAAESRRDLGVTFVGGLSPTVHGRRTALLERIASRVPLEIWGWGAEELPSNSAILKRYRGRLWGLEMYAVLARSRISLNGHIDAAEGFANNMRLFESTGVGALVLTETAPNLADLFTPGQDVIPYDDDADLTEKISHYLEHDDERLAIAAAGQRRTLGEHTYRERMPELVQMLASRLPNERPSDEPLEPDRKPDPMQR